MRKAAALLSAILLCGCAELRYWFVDDPDTPEPVRADPHEQAAMAAQSAYLQCVDRAAIAFAASPVTATEAVGAAHGKCSSEYGEYEALLTRWVVRDARGERRRYLAGEARKIAATTRQKTADRLLANVAAWRLANPSP